MSKYDNYYKNAYSDLPYDEEQQLKIALMPEEQVLWKGKPKKLAHVLNSMFSGIFPFAMIWLCFDGFFIAMLVGTGEISKMFGFIVPFFAIHLMPVWIWLFGVIKAVAKADYNTYAITDKRILIKSDSVLFNSVYFEDIANAGVKLSFADKMSGVGDIYIDVVNVGKMTILDIADYQEVYAIIQKKVYELRQSGHVPGKRTNNTADEGFDNFDDGFGGGMYNDGMQNGGFYNSGAQGDNGRTQYFVNGQVVNQNNNYYSRK